MSVEERTFLFIGFCEVDNDVRFGQILWNDLNNESIWLICLFEGHFAHSVLSSLMKVVTLIILEIMIFDS
jgi:hypothetical protein